MALLGAALGAFGAHALSLGERESIWETAVQYQMIHALALLLWAIRPSRTRGPALCFLIGVFLFSGSLYGLCLGGPGNVLGPITPLGGVSFLIGWAWWSISWKPEK
ncbi:MAG: DUF423 domain-containing protein [Verrucomicrobiota bacterium]